MINQKMKNPDLSIKHLCHFYIFYIYLFWLFFDICAFWHLVNKHFNKFFFVTYKPLLASAVLKSLAKFTLLIKKGWMSNASSLSYEKGISLNENLICIVIFYDLLEF